MCNSNFVLEIVMIVVVRLKFNHKTNLVNSFLSNYLLETVMLLFVLAEMQRKTNLVNLFKINYCLEKVWWLLYRLVFDSCEKSLRCQRQIWFCNNYFLEAEIIVFVTSEM